MSTEDIVGWAFVGLFFLGVWWGWPGGYDPIHKTMRAKRRRSRELSDERRRP